MKRVGDASFFRVLDRLLGAEEIRGTATHGEIDGATWRRERHSYGGDAHAFSLEVTTVAATGKSAWTLMIVKEFWWQPPNRDVFKTVQWAHVVAGRRNEVMGWIARQERRLDAMQT